MSGLLMLSLRVFAPRGTRLRWALVLLLALTLAAVEYATAVLVFGVLDAALAGEGSPTLDLPVPDLSLPTLLVVAGAAFLTRSILGIVSMYFTESVVQGSASEVSAKLHRRYIYAPYGFHLGRDSTELVRTIVLSVDRAAGDVVRPLLAIATQLPMVIVLGALLLLIAPGLTLGGAATVGIVLLVVLRLVQPRLRRLGSISERVTKSILDNLADTFSSLREIKVYGSEEPFDDRFGANRRHEARLRVRRFTLAAVPSKALEFIVMAGLLVLIGVATSGASLESLIPTLGVFAYATLRIVPSINRLVSSVNTIRFGQQAIENVADDLEGFEDPVRDRSRKPGGPLFTSSITLEDITFSYPGDRGLALDGVSLRVGHGEMLAIVGSSGAGKSSLIDVLLGLLEPDDGSLLVDQSAVRPEGWRTRVGVVSQDIIIINGTLRDNVAFGAEDVSDAQVIDALRAAQLSKWFEGLPHGLDTHLGESGKLVSGGERQRIAIARSLFRHPELLVLDEATSDLDAATEAALMDELKDRAITTVIVSHRLAPILAADRIVLMEAGKVVAEGTYAEMRARVPDFTSKIGA